jgi:hypothetical protein
MIGYLHSVERRGLVILESETITSNDTIKLCSETRGCVPTIEHTHPFPQFFPTVASTPKVLLLQLQELTTARVIVLHHHRDVIEDLSLQLSDRLLLVLMVHVK